jgi:hypothetical protein
VTRQTIWHCGCGRVFLRGRGSHRCLFRALAWPVVILRALLLLMAACGGPILADAQPVQPAACPECPGALRWQDYDSNGAAWRECWCRPGLFADFTFPLVPGDTERVRAVWLAYQARGCRP